MGGAGRGRGVKAAGALRGVGGRAAKAAGVGASGRGCRAGRARRYVDQAAAGGRLRVPEPGAVFTVKLPAGLAGRVRAQARGTGVTISALVAQALEEFLSRGHRNHPRG